MGISYDKMLKLFQERGITSYTMRKEKIIGQATYLVRRFRAPFLLRWKRKTWIVC